MKAAILTLLIATFSIGARAVDVGFTYDIKSHAQLGWKKVDKFKQSVSCYIKGKGDENTDLPEETVDRSMNIAQATSTTSLSLPSGAYSEISLGSVDFVTSHAATGELDETYSLDINDRIRWNDFQNLNDTDCVIHEYHWHVDSHRIAGQYSLKIKMPADAWTLRLKISGRGQAVQLAGTKTDGDLHSVSVFNDTWFYVWGQPNSTIVIPLKLAVNSGGGNIGHLDLSIRKPGLLSGQDALAALKGVVGQVRGGTPTSIETHAFMNAGAAIAGHADVAKRVIGQMGLDPIRSLNTDLMWIANHSFPKNPDEKHLKAMAATVVYELALALLDDLKVFCDTKVVYLPMTDQTVKRQGFIIANFWVSQAVASVADLNFPEIETYFEEITRWENNGLKYSDIANDPKAFKQISDSFIKLRRFSRFAWPVYGALKASLQKVVNTFGTIGSDPDAINAIYQMIETLAAKQMALNREFQAFNLGFTKSNTAAISSSSMVAELKDLEAGNAQLAQRMNDVLKFYSLNSDDSANNVVAMMTDALANQVAVFEKPLTSTFIEPIRSAFAQSARTQKLEASYGQCLEVQ